jgi:hypothetical protein
MIQNPCYHTLSVTHNSFTDYPTNISARTLSPNHNESFGRALISKVSLDFESILSHAILFLKRTFQPSLIRKKRKHGFLAR